MPAMPDKSHSQQHTQRETRSSRGKEMIKAIPPSPALSHVEMPSASHGLPTGHMSDYLNNRHSNVAFYPQSEQPQQQHIAMDAVHPQSQPATRYSTPVSRTLYQPPSQQQLPQQPYYSNYPQPPQYDHSPYAYTDDYGTASSQPYSTPVTSPPTPTRDASLRMTRSGAALPRGGKVGSSSRPPPPPKKRPAKERARAVKKSPHLSGPMSEITKDSHIPVVDIASYVHRSTEERQREVATGKIPGKIKRPMNAFMLYRKAYQNRAKEWCSQHNHQIVSQVCGDSWPLEPDHVRAQFTEWAKVERDNHQKAHPSYKFTPSKPHKAKSVAAVKRGRHEVEEDDDPNDPDWHGSKKVKRSNTPLDDDEYQLFPLYPGGGGGGYGLPDAQNRSTFHATNPGKPMPQPYDTNGSVASGHYYQTVQVRHGNVESIIYKKTPSPAMLQPHHHLHHHSSPHGGYELGGYAPPPPPPAMHQHPAPHHQQYLDAPHLNVSQPAHFAQRVDPSLLAGAEAELPLDLAGYEQYPHQLDPAHAPQWNAGAGSPVQQQAPWDPLQFDGDFGALDQLGDAIGGSGGGGDGLLPEEQAKIFGAQPWERYPTEGDDWNTLGELSQEHVTEMKGEGS